MKATDGKFYCGFCGNAIRKKRGKVPPECCSEPCAKDVGRPDDWHLYLDAVPSCTACEGPKDDNRYRWCSRCREAWRISKPREMAT